MLLLSSFGACLSIHLSFWQRDEEQTLRNKDYLHLLKKNLIENSSEINLSAERRKASVRKWASCCSRGARANVNRLCLGTTKYSSGYHMLLVRRLFRSRNLKQEVRFAAQIFFLTNSFLDEFNVRVAAQDSFTV
jgi:hypothetical protein